MVAKSSALRQRSDAASARQPSLRAGRSGTSPIVAHARLSTEIFARRRNQGFFEQVKIELGFRAPHRQVAVADGLYTLRERCRLMATISIGKNVALRQNNTVRWQTNLEATEA